MTTQNESGVPKPSKPERATITFLGTADAFNTGGRANSCYLVEDSLGAYTIDFGPTALMKAQETACRLEELDAVYVTHLHGDHIGGFPMLFLHLQYDLHRTKPLVIAGPPNTKAFVDMLRESTYPSAMGRPMPFEIHYKTWVPNESLEVVNRQVFSIPAVHDEQAEPHSLRIEGPNYSLAVSGDTGWQETLVELSKDVSMFVCEATAEKAGYWGHLSVEEHRRYRQKLTPKQLVLSHLSKNALDAARADAQAYDWTVAYDGLKLPLNPT